MTLIGKILVIVLTAMSIIFLGISTVTLTTATDWKASIAGQNKELQELDAQLKPAQAARDDFKGKHENAKKERAGATKAVENLIAAHKLEIQKDQSEFEAASKTLLDHQKGANEALQDAKAKTAEIVRLREEVAAVDEQASKFKLRQEELDSEIANLRRMLDVAERNSSQISKSH